tara:strand:- start:3380 stop:3691 length:312 start_codon:yes stop_codon:yes gene_type:complete
MATNPFAGAGLSQFGQEMTGIPTQAAEDSTIANTITGLKDIGVVALKNMFGIPASMPVPAPSSKPVPPKAGVAPIAPVVSLNPVSTDEELHPELDLTTQTKLF